jgi:hypothetical protein
MNAPTIRRPTRPTRPRLIVALCHDGRTERYWLGAHAPTLSSDEVGQLHRLCVDATGVVGPEIHHPDIVRVAPASFRDELVGSARDRTAGVGQRLDSH